MRFCALPLPQLLAGFLNDKQTRNRDDARDNRAGAGSAAGRDIGPEAAAAAAGIDFLPFPDLDQSVREDVALIRASPVIPDDVTVRGFVYYVETGRLQEVH